ncbi:40447_t:CDS:2 [Gigaspora margarita]|uniref:40447_t:CDS:1 n=1 Tax=Gigaspora margarita TaxID=4874 RepID=A0ABM8VXH3_GIGMA|nr:40447_t:CDS:2 [Gigaspora margarita]
MPRDLCIDKDKSIYPITSSHMDAILIKSLPIPLQSPHSFEMTNAPKEDKLDASIKCKSGKGTISGESKKKTDADDKSVSFTVIVKDGDKATFTITLEDEDEEISASVDVTIKEDKDDKKKKD